MRASGYGALVAVSLMLMPKLALVQPAWKIKLVFAWEALGLLALAALLVIRPNGTNRQLLLKVFRGYIVALLVFLGSWGAILAFGLFARAFL